MDHAANDVLRPIVIEAQDNVRRFIELVCQAKGRTHISYPRGVSTPLITDRGLPIRGLHNILSYLEEQYPDPPLTFETPERRAIVRMAVDQILQDLYVDDLDPQHPTLLALAEALTHSRFVMDRLSLIDLALVPVAPAGKLWAQHEQYVDETLSL